MSDATSFSPSNINSRGLAVAEELLGKTRADVLAEAADAQEFGSRFARLAIEFVFGQVWGDSSLSRREQSIATMAVLIGLRQFSEVENHILIALKNGLSPADVESVLVHLLPYAGFPAVAGANAAAQRALSQLESIEADRS